MGAWGIGIFSNDVACDVRDMYHDFLAYGYDDLEAERAVTEYWIPQVSDTEDEPVFWFALAATEHKYGRLSDAVREKALYYIEHNMDDLSLWSGAQKRKRAAILKKLAVTLSLPSERKKIPPLRSYSTGWNPGDIVLASLDESSTSSVHFFAMQVFDVLDIPCSNYIKEGPRNQFPVIGIYRWIGGNIPDAYELIQRGFVKRKGSVDCVEAVPYVACFITTERECRNYRCSVIGNSKLYLDYVDENKIKQQVGAIWGGFKSSISMLEYQIENSIWR